MTVIPAQTGRDTDAKIMAEQLSSVLVSFWFLLICSGASDFHIKPSPFKAVQIGMNFDMTRGLKLYFM